jgi:hypothetical protein
MNAQLELKGMHFDLSKALELGVTVDWLAKTNPTSTQLRSLVKGLLYLRAVPQARQELLSVTHTQGS